MPKKSAPVEYYEEIDSEPEPEPVKISKRTGKPARPLSELQKQVLAKGRELAIQKRKDLLIGVDLEKRALNIKKAKEDLRQARDIKQKEKIEQQKELYEQTVKEDDEDSDRLKTVKPKKKKIIKYVEESSDSEEEVIVRKKKDKTKMMMEQVSRQNLIKKLNDEQSNSLAKMLAPSYY